jgi:predicted phage baseplate assembly protein
VPEIDMLLPNTVEAHQLTTVREEVLGNSDGNPDQIFNLYRKPIFVGDDRENPIGLRTTVGDRSAAWTRRDDFLASGPDDLHYVLNTTAGTVRFGDGKRGRIPEPGSEVVSSEYRAGGGLRGNEAQAHTITTLQTSLPGVASVTNWRAAAGGRDEESADELFERVPGLLRQRGRAVTAEDFETLARDVGGVRAAVALAETHPEHRGVAVPGSVTVVIVPKSDQPKPMPSRELIRAVCQELDRHRPLTTEIHVAPPSYQAVRVETKVEADAGASFDEVTERVFEALKTFFAHRKFGSDLVPSELYSAIRRAHEATVSVPALNVYVDGRLYRPTERIVVPADGLLYGEDHVVTVVPPGDE